MLFVSLLSSSVHGLPWTQQQQTKNLSNDSSSLGEPTGLMALIADELFALCKSHRFSLALLGIEVDEIKALYFVTFLCNIAYGVLVLVGFLTMPRNKMLWLTAATVLVGPSIILVIVACVAAGLAACALYPRTSVASLWLVFFLQSKAFQAMGKRLNLDHDGDGDVDTWDVLSALAKTKIGALLRLDKAHSFLNSFFKSSTVDRLESIEQKLDELVAKNAKKDTVGRKVGFF